VYFINPKKVSKDEIEETELAIEWLPTTVQDDFPYIQETHAASRT